MRGKTQQELGALQVDLETTLFPERLKLLRLSRKMSQSDLARALGVTRATISAWESRNQRPTLEVLVQVARYFGVSTDYLLGATNRPQPPSLPAWVSRLPVAWQTRLADNPGVLDALFRLAEKADMNDYPLEALEALLDVLVKGRDMLKQRGPKQGTPAEEASAEGPEPPKPQARTLKKRGPKLRTPSEALEPLEPQE